MNKVLIIGIDSFTGFHLKQHLENNNYEIYGTSLFNEGINIYKCDITLKTDIKNILNIVKPNYIIHLSGISFVGHEDIMDFYKINTIGTINILDTLLELKIKLKKILLVSSATIYGNQKLEVLDETLCPNPSNHYGVSKYAMECLAKNYFDRLPIIITRPFNYTGVGQSLNFLIPKIVSHYKNNKKIIELGNINVVREFNDINFVCEAYEKLIKSNIKSESINVCTGRGIKLLDIINSMNKLANYDIEIKINPSFIRKDEIMYLVGSPNKLFELIGKLEQKNFEETLSLMLNNF